MSAQHHRKPKINSVREAGIETRVPFAFFKGVAKALGVSTACVIHFMEEIWGPADFRDEDALTFCKRRLAPRGRRSAQIKKDASRGSR